MSDILKLGSTIGIIGGGQLGRMLAMSAARYGYKTHIFDPIADCPASQTANKITVAEYTDVKSLNNFSSQVDCITFEFENIDVASLQEISKLIPINPTLEVIAISQDRILEKSSINNIGIPTTKWEPIYNLNDLKNIVAKKNQPVVVKTSRLGYDGKGQKIISTVDQCEDVWSKLNPKPLVVESLVKFTKEISVIVARNQTGDIVSFEPTENHHVDHILDTSCVPAAIKHAVANEAISYAVKIAEELKLIGLLAIEMFVTDEGKVLVNELAPRPHNSGHWTIDACDYSQFDLHIRAIAGLPLISPKRHSDVSMKNLIGPEGIEFGLRSLSIPGVIPHFYGKTSAKSGRKMGHLTQLFKLWNLPSSKVW